MKFVARHEWPLAVSIVTTALFLFFGRGWLGDLSSPAWFALMLAWLFGAILISAFAVVRHAEGLAERIGEPFGTLVLTISMSGMEMMMIAAVMYSGAGGASLGRDTMLAILMVVLNGLVGASLLLGGLRYHEQTYNLYGANAFLGLIVPLAVLGLVMPSFTVSSPGPTLSPLQSTFLILMSVGLYGVFLAIQTMRHRDYFVATGTTETGARQTVETRDAPRVHSAKYHGLFLLAYVPFIVLPGQADRETD
jgi:Ca2+:H+ antiporter